MALQGANEIPTAIPTQRRMRWQFSRRLLVRSFKLFLCVVALLGIYVATTAIRYGVSIPVAVDGVRNELALTAIRAAVAIYDPSEPRFASTGPNFERLPNHEKHKRIEQVLMPGTMLTLPSGGHIESLSICNPTIVRSPFVFRYQPHDEPRLHELRRKYGLDAVVAPAKGEFEEMVILRNWTRSQFRRRDYQPASADFDALEILDRNLRDHGKPYVPVRDMDPCQLFPMLYCQVLLSMGHQARLVSADHGMAEVWSNQHRKWILMDAELNHHFEEDGIPLNLVELFERNLASPPTKVRLIRGVQTSGDDNTMKVHLRIENPSVEGMLKMFVGPLDLVDLRNDWMTNRYFRGHPARSESNSLVFLHSQNTMSRDFRSRLRNITSNKDDFYWTLNQTEIRGIVRDDGDLDLAFETVAPNFECFELAIDGKERIRYEAPTFRWRLHAGDNGLTIRSINRFGIRGIASEIRLSVTGT